jgi:hypothetical protein
VDCPTPGSVLTGIKCFDLDKKLHEGKGHSENKVTDHCDSVQLFCQILVYKAQSVVIANMLGSWQWQGQNIASQQYSLESNWELSSSQTEEQASQTGFEVGSSATVGFEVGDTAGFGVTASASVTVHQSQSKSWSESLSKTHSVSRGGSTSITATSPDCADGNLWQFIIAGDGPDAAHANFPQNSFACVPSSMGNMKMKPKCPPGYCGSTAGSESTVDRKERMQLRLEYEDTSCQCCFDATWAKNPDAVKGLVCPPPSPSPSELELPSSSEAAKGQTGPPGPQGPPGMTGLDGPKGDAGRTGPQGLTGATGSNGPRGLVGSKGPKGDAGRTSASPPEPELPACEAINVAGVTASVATMKRNGWKNTLVNTGFAHGRCADGGAFTGFNNGAGVGEISMQMPAAGSGTVHFGNCWNEGVVVLYVNNERVASAARNTNVVGEITFKAGDTVKLKDEGKNSVVRLESISITCS